MKEVYVQRGHGSDQYGTYINIDKISGVHWDSVSGGVHQRQNGYSLYGYIDYHTYKAELKCSGRHDYGYNDMKVLIPKVTRDDPTYAAYKELCEAAGPKPKIISTCPQGKPPCTKRILYYLNDGVETRGKLRELLYKDGYQVQTIRNALRSLIRQNKIITCGSAYSKTQIIKLVDVTSRQ